MLKWSVFPKPQEFRKRIVGSVPKRSSRSKLQSRRSRMTMEINKELLLRGEAEAEYKAACDKNRKENAELELRLTNSNLQLLKEQLAQLNSLGDLCQNAEVTPMISPGLKETKELELREVLKDFIESHYHDDGKVHEDSIAELMDMRQSMRPPVRDSLGLALLFQYFNQLDFVERRFFSSGECGGLLFEWYDSLTGVPCYHKDISYEKASVLFNAAALYSQIGTRQDRTTSDGLETATENYLSAAGIFQHILDNFSDLPGKDLHLDILQLLVQLMCAQARETNFHKMELLLVEENDGTDPLLQLGQEAADVSLVYDAVLETAEHVKYQVPYSWLCMVQVKQKHYMALADYYVATALLAMKGEGGGGELEMFHSVYEEDERSVGVPSTEEKIHYLGKAHLREALLIHEETLAVLNKSLEIRNKDVFLSVLQHTHQQFLRKYEDVDQEDDFQELVEPPCILPHSTVKYNPTSPDFSLHPTQDMFQALGPIETFSTMQQWEPPRDIHIMKKEGGGFGFSLRGECPSVVGWVEEGSMAEASGMNIGDYLVSVYDREVRWYKHEQVINLINMLVDVVRIRIITPVYKDDNKKFGSKKQFFGLKSISMSKIFNNPTIRKSSAPLGLSHDEESLSSSSEFSVNLKGSWNSRMSWTEDM